MDRAMIEKVAKVLGHEFSPAGDEAQEANYIYRAIEWYVSLQLSEMDFDSTFFLVQDDRLISIFTHDIVL
jgi:hypothetical protein